MTALLLVAGPPDVSMMTPTAKYLFDAAIRGLNNGADICTVKAKRSQLCRYLQKQHHYISASTTGLLS